MDFKIGDSLEENGSEKQNNRKIPLIIVIVLSIVIGLSVFFISNLIFGDKKKDNTPSVSTNIDLEDENVKILYDYVTYGVRNKRYEKFIKEQSVKLEDFNNYESVYKGIENNISIYIVEVPNETAPSIQGFAKPPA